MLAQGANWIAPCHGDLPIHRGVFDGLLPLLAHGALEGGKPPSPAAGVAVDLQPLFANPDVRHFVESARQSTGVRGVALRTRDVGLSAGNPLTARFVPMAAPQVPAALRVALRAIGVALRDARKCPLRAACVCWLGTQCLLAIHPFRDGNGRSMRAWFAANCLRHVGPAPSALLAVLLADGGDAQRYHQAAWALRAGMAEPMARLFIDAEAEARAYLDTWFGAPIHHGFLMECHAWLRARLAYPMNDQCGIDSGRASNRRA